MTKPFIITSDASTSAIGYVLSQLDDQGREHPIAFNGRSLRGSEKNWGITELEGLALVEAIKEYHPFLNHQRFTVYTDHISLTWLQSLKSNNGRLYRWSLLLQSYSFDIKYKAGKSNNNADALSRREYPPPPPEDPDDEVVNDDIHFSMINVVPVRAEIHQQPPGMLTSSPTDNESPASNNVESIARIVNPINMTISPCNTGDIAPEPDGFSTEVFFTYPGES